MSSDVIRYVPTYVDERGTRTLMRGIDGSTTFETREDAQAWLDALVTGTSADALRSAWGSSPRFDVRACRCRLASHDRIPASHNRQGAASEGTEVFRQAQA